MTAKVVDSGSSDDWIDADLWAIECNDNGDTVTSAIGGQLWSRIADGKRRD